MKVGDLVELLETYPSDLDVVVDMDDLTEDMIYENEIGYGPGKRRPVLQIQTD